MPERRAIGLELVPAVCALLKMICFKRRAFAIKQIDELFSREMVARRCWRLIMLSHTFATSGSSALRSFRTARKILCFVAFSPIPKLLPISSIESS